MYEKVTHIEGKRCKRPCETTVCQFFADVVLHIKPLFSASVRQRDSWLAPNLSLYTWHNVKTHSVVQLCHQYPLCLGMFTESKLGAGGWSISVMIENSMNSDCGSEGIRWAQVHSLFVYLVFLCTTEHTHLDARLWFLQPPSPLCSVA